MLAYTYIEKGKFELLDKPKPVLQDSRDAIVKVTLTSMGMRITVPMPMVVALHDEAQELPLPEMYGKNLIFKTGGVDGCDCAEIL